MLATVKVADIKKMLADFPDDRDVLFIVPEGVAHPIKGVDPLEVFDTATGQKVLTLELKLDGRWFNFTYPKVGEKFDTPRINSGA